MTEIQYYEKQINILEEWYLNVISQTNKDKMLACYFETRKLIEEVREQGLYSSKLIQMESTLRLLLISEVVNP